MEQSIKQQVLQVATRRFARFGYAGTSLQQIAEEVGIRKPSLLYHYPSKEALRHAVLDELIEQWQRRLPTVLTVAAGGVDRFEAVISEVMGFFRAQPDRAQLLLRECVDFPRETRERLGSTMESWAPLLVEAIGEGQEANRVRTDVDAEAWLIEIVVLVIGTFAAADLATAVFDRQASSDQLDRHVAEVSRIARASLFTDHTVARSAIPAGTA